jgi:hypothetical protein
MALQNDQLSVLGEPATIRHIALHYALTLEARLPPARRVQLDDIPEDNEAFTAEQAAVLSRREQDVERAAVDRVLRHAQLFAEYIGNGLSLDGIGALAGEPDGNAT